MKPGALWPLGLAGVLGITVVANVALLYTASRSDATATEPDYYRKALAWDSTMAQARENVRLGWQVAGRLEPDGKLGLVLHDQAGAALDSAHVAVEGFALAHAGTRYEAVLTADGEGRYEAQLAQPRTGLQEIRISVDRGARRYTAVLRGVPGAELAPWH